MPNERQQSPWYELTKESQRQITTHHDWSALSARQFIYCVYNGECYMLRNDDTPAWTSPATYSVIAEPWCNTDTSVKEIPLSELSTCEKLFVQKAVNNCIDTSLHTASFFIWEDIYVVGLAEYPAFHTVFEPVDKPIVDTLSSAALLVFECALGSQQQRYYLANLMPSTLKIDCQSVIQRIQDSLIFPIHLKEFHLAISGSAVVSFTNIT